MAGTGSRMKNRIAIVLGIATILSVVGVFKLKLAVIEAKRELARVERAILNERIALQTLEIDWGYLTRDERLAQLASQLGMSLATGRRIVEADRIGRRRHIEYASESLPVVLPSGGAIELRFKPVATFDMDWRDLR